jgi:putative cell wall-binding protein
LRKIYQILIVFALFICMSASSVGAASGNLEDRDRIKNGIQKFSEQTLLTEEINSTHLNFLKSKIQKKHFPNQVIQLGEVFESEPNDMLKDANNIMIDDIVVGTFGWSHDVDFFRVTNPKTQDIYLAGTTDTFMNDLGIGLVTPNSELLYPDDGYIDGSDKFLFYHSLPPGDYYVVSLDLFEYGEEGLYGFTLFTGEDIADEEEKSIYRIAGSDRYETAIQISRAGWPDGADTVVIARDNTFPDALAGAPLAYYHDAPILLNPKDYLHSNVLKRIKELGAKEVIILGGEGAISREVKSQLETNGLQVQRIGGETRYETAAKIAVELGYYEEAIIAYGGNFPDALSIASYAAINEIPILLTPKEKLAATTKEALTNVENTIIVGGEAAISNIVEEQLIEHNPYRISGNDRYETSVKIAEELGIQGESITIATGENFADALTGSVLAAKYQEPIILVQKNNVPNSVFGYIDAHHTWYYTILGGKGAVSETVVEQLYNH